MSAGLVSQLSVFLCISCLRSVFLVPLPWKVWNTPLFWNIHLKLIIHFLAFEILTPHLLTISSDPSWPMLGRAIFWKCMFEELIRLFFKPGQNLKSQYFYWLVQIWLQHLPHFILHYDLSLVSRFKIVTFNSPKTPWKVPAIALSRCTARSWK